MLTLIPTSLWVLFGILLSYASSDWTWTHWFKPPHYRGQTSDELVRIMRGPDCNKSIRAALRLNDLGIESDETIPALRRALRDKNPDTRFHALFLAGFLGPKTLAVAPELIEIALHDEEIDQRIYAVGDLAFAKPPTQEILDTLTKSLEHSSDLVRSNAAWSLGKLGPQAESAVASLRKKIRDPNTTVRIQAVWALWRIASDQPDIPILTSAMGQKGEQFESLLVCLALADMGPIARAATPELKRRLTTADPTARPCFAEALWKIEKNPEAMTCLIASLKENEFAAAKACGVLQKLSSDAKPALPALWKLLESAKGRLRIDVATAIWQISHDEKAIEVLARELYRTEDCALAASHLKDIGAPAKSAVPCLLAVLNDPDEHNCDCAASALLKIDPRAATAAGIK